MVSYSEASFHKSAGRRDRTDNGDISDRHVLDWEYIEFSVFRAVPGKQRYAAGQLGLRGKPRARYVARLRYLPTSLHTHSCHGNDASRIMGSNAQDIARLPGTTRTSLFCKG